MTESINVTSFTREELEPLSRKQLLRLCNFYKIELTHKEKKSKTLIIDRLCYEIESMKEEAQAPEVPMSVRVKRILESNKE